MIKTETESDNPAVDFGCIFSSCCSRNPLFLKKQFISLASYHRLNVPKSEIFQTGGLLNYKPSYSSSMIHPYHTLFLNFSFLLRSKNAPIYVKTNTDTKKTVSKVQYWRSHVVLDAFLSNCHKIQTAKDFFNQESKKMVTKVFNHFSFF